MSGQIEEEILTLERQYWQFPEIRALEIRLAALEQSLMASWMYVGSSAPPPPNTTFDGSIQGCVNTYTAATVALTITDIGGTVLWTGATGGAGTFSGSLYLASNATLFLNATGPNVRFATTTTFSAAFTAGTLNHLGGGHGMTPATGYACPTGCNDPLKTTLNFTFNGACTGGFPSDTFTYQARPAALAALIGAGSSWIGALNNITLSGHNDWTYFYPGASGINVFRSGTNTVISNGSSPTLTCPAGATNFSLALTCGFLNFGGTLAE